MSDNITVTENISYGSRLKSALSGLIIGPILIIVSCFILWNNEYNSASTISNVEQGRKNLNETSSTSINKGLDGKFIHTFGPIIGENLSDISFGITVSGAILERKVEMYQWKEESSSKTEENLGGSETKTTTYTYTKEWSDSKIDSSSFNQIKGHENISNWQYENSKTKSKIIKVGDFFLSDSISNLLIPNSTVIIPNGQINNSTGITANSNIIYIGENQSDPKIGDMKVSFLYLPNNSIVSILGEQNPNGIIGEYKGNISRIENGQKTSNEMFDNILTENKFLTWIFRILGLVLMFIGWNLLFKILPTLLAFVPFIGNIIGFGTGIIAFLLTIILGGLIIAVAWFTSRPFLALAIISVVCIITFYIYKNKSKKTTNIDNIS